MNMLTKKKSLLAILALSLIVTAAWAFPPRVSWQPESIAPGSVAPGAQTVFSVTLIHTGILPIPATGQLRVVAEGEIAPFVSIGRPIFPSVLKRGSRIPVMVTVAVPQGVPLSVKRGSIVLERVLPNGKVKEIFRAEALPVELTFSPIPIPADPGAVGKANLLGVDADGNGVRDDVDRFIVFSYPESEKKREVFKQTARALSVYLRDSEDKAKTRENGEANHRAIECSIHVFNGDLYAAFDHGDAFRARFLDTKERSRAYARADQKMGGYVSNNGFASERFERRRAACSFDADSLPN